MTKTTNRGEIKIYKTDHGTDIKVSLDKETVWLDAHLIANLFKVNRPAIVKHIQNIYKSGELKETSTCSKMEQVASDGKKRTMNLYNLDIIISVGYRVNSKQATQFRQWATQRLKEHLINGYTTNQRRLDQLQQTVKLIQKSGNNSDLNLAEAKGLLDILSNYTQSFVLLNKFDSQTLEEKNLNEKITYEINYKEAKTAIDELKKQLVRKKEATALFGNEKDQSFEGTLMVAQSDPSQKENIVKLIINLINEQ